MKKTKILVLNDGAKYKNWGIKACIDGLYNIIDLKQSDFEIISLPHSFMHKQYSWSPTILGRQVFSETSRVASKLLSPYHLLPRVADEFEYVAKMWTEGKGGNGADIFIEMAKSADCVIFNAEGSTYRKNIGAIKGLFMLWYAKTVLKKKAIFLNGSVTLTLVDSTLPGMIRKVFSTIDYSVVREPYSYNSIQSFYPEIKNIKVAPDSVFSLDFSKIENSKSLQLPENFFCFSLSMLPMDTRFLDESVLVSLIRELKKVVPQAVFLAKDVEDQLLKSISDKTDSIFLGGELEYEEVAQVLKKAKFLFSGRYHHCIFSTMVGTPVLPLTTSSHKIHGLSKLFNGVMPTPYDATDLSNQFNSIVEKAKEIAANNSSIRSEYKKQSEVLHKEAFLPQKILKEVLSIEN